MAYSDPESSISLFRLVTPKWADSALSGEGARKYGGRWNSPGKPCVYLSTSRALAALELLVHLTTPEFRAKKFTLIEYSILSDLIQNASLPKTNIIWQKQPPGPAFRKFGDDWLKKGKFAALRVPSILIPEESNILFNPTDSSPLAERSRRSFFFDPRLHP